MEKRIREYEVYIKNEMKKGKNKDELFKLHSEMVRDFQHERLVHLIVMFFFVGATIFLLSMTFFLELYGHVSSGTVFALGALDLLMTIVSGAYIKHYYFLENHVQALYDLFEKMIK